MVLSVLPKLLDFVVTRLALSPIHGKLLVLLVCFLTRNVECPKWLEAFFAFHRLYLLLVNEFPLLSFTLDERTARFVKSHNRGEAPKAPLINDQLGELLCMNSANTLVADEDTNKLYSAVIDEQLDRDVKDLVQIYPELDDPKFEGDRASITFAATVHHHRKTLWIHWLQFTLLPAVASRAQGSYTLLLAV